MKSKYFQTLIVLILYRFGQACESTLSKLFITLGHENEFAIAINDSEECKSMGFFC